FFIISSIAVQTPDRGISNLLAVGTTFTGSGNLYCKWELSPGSGNALQMSKVLQEKGFGSLPSSTKTNPRDHVKSISTIVEAVASLICRIKSHQYAVSTEQNSTLMYETKQTTIIFPIRWNDYYCKDKKGSNGPQFLEAYSYGASHVNISIPRKKKDPGIFTLPCYINNVFNALADLVASVSVMPLSTYHNLGLGELAHTKLTVELADRTVKYPKGIAKNMLVEDMGAYRDEGMGDVIFDEPFLKEVGINARRFEGIINIYNGNEDVTYQMVRSHPRFKHHTN
nr:hypothetical protein [Tanacetum cinerariifolium]